MADTDLVFQFYFLPHLMFIMNEFKFIISYKAL